MLSGRAQRVLGRFPEHMEADQPGKLIAAVVQSLTRDQDVQAADAQGIRMAHRLGDARELYDLLLLAGMHGIGRNELAVLFTRLQMLADGSKALDDAGDADKADIAEALLKHWPLEAEQPLKHFALELGFDPDSGSDDAFDLAKAIEVLTASLADANKRAVLVNATRDRIANIARIHADGNGTVKALMAGAANALDLDMGTIQHSDDRFWHAAPVTDRLRLKRPSGKDDGRQIGIEPSIEYLGLEENPKVPAERKPAPRRHGQLFEYIRKGFDDALLEIRIRGIGNRTVSPMLVNRDSGHGVGVFGQVPDGEELVFTQQGRVLLDGSDITSRAYAWQGACFAKADPLAQQRLRSGNAREASEAALLLAQDFVFAAAGDKPEEGRVACFAEMSPFDALDRDAMFPHAGDNLPMPSIGVGKTRFAFFVQHGFFGRRRASAPDILGDIASADPIFTSIDSTPIGDSVEFNGPFTPVGNEDPFGRLSKLWLQTVQPVTARHGIGRIGGAVFAARPAAGQTLAAVNASDPAAEVGLRWLERKAYAVRVLIPNRFRGYGDRSDGSLELRGHLQAALQRFRPAGVDIEVDFVEDRWVLGKASLPIEGEAAKVDAISRIQSDTQLWPNPESLEPEPEENL